MDIIYLALGIVFIVIGVLTLYFLDKARFNRDGPVKSIIYLITDVFRIILDLIRFQDRQSLDKYRNLFPKIGIFLLFLIGIIFIRLSI